MASRPPGSGSHWIRPTTRLAIYLRDGLACVYCGQGLETSALLSLDHRVPVSKGGSNAPSNLVTACVSCNSARGSRGLTVFIATVASQTGQDPALIRARLRSAYRRRLPREDARKIIAGRCVSPLTSALEELS